MSTNPLRREGSYWKPVLDYGDWDADTPAGNGSGATHTAVAEVEPCVRHDLCRHCGAEFVVDSPFCRMCGRGKSETLIASEKKSLWRAVDFSQLRRSLGLSIGAMICFILGVACVGAGVATGFIYTANTLVDWQAIQAWRCEWLIAAGVAFVCGILLNGRKTTQI